MARPKTSKTHPKAYGLILWRSPNTTWNQGGWHQGGWRWRLTTRNGRTIAASTEGYKSKHWAVANIQDAAGIPVSAPGRLDRYTWKVLRDDRGLAVATPL